MVLVEAKAIAFPSERSLRFIDSGEVPDMALLPAISDIRAPRLCIPRPRYATDARRIRNGAPRVPRINGHRDHAKVLEAVVQAVSVDVIDRHAIRNGTVVHLPNDTMHVIPFVAACDAPIVRVPVRLDPTGFIANAHFRTGACPDQSPPQRTILERLIPQLLGRSLSRGHPYLHSGRC